MFSKSHTKYIQSLHYKKFRDEYGVFIAEGPKVVEELLLEDNMTCREIFSLPSWLHTNQQLLGEKNVEQVYELKDFELEKISALASPNQVLAVFEKKETSNHVSLEGKITIALDAIQDPGNMGTMVRTADWFGIENINCSPACADMYNPRVVQSTMGSLARVDIRYGDLPQFLKDNKQIKTYAATLDGKDIKLFPPMKEGIIIIGNESKGISKEVLQLTHAKISISKKGHAESLNAGVAMGIILSHFL